MSPVIEDSPPSPEELRRAVCDAMAIAPGLVRYCTRYTRSVDDAEDAYQRAMEIALTRAPSAERSRFMAWLFVVLKNEALAIARSRGRETPIGDEAVTRAAGRSPAPGPDLRAEWRERYLAIQDAMGCLTEAQRICLMLRSRGAGHALIGELTGFSDRKVERSIVEGRARLREWEVRVAEGERCLRLEEAIARVAVGEATRRERRDVGRHVRHCRSCRTLLARRGTLDRTFGALVPVALLGEGLATATPDPGPYLAAMDRAAAGLTVRAGQAFQLLMDLPGNGLARVGAAAGAVVLMTAAAVPMIGGDGDRPVASGMRPVTIERAAEAPQAPAEVVAHEPDATTPAERPERRRQAGAATGARRAPVAQAGRTRTPKPRATTPRATPAPVAVAVAAPSPSAPAAEPVPAPVPAPAPAPAAPVPDSLDPGLGGTPSGTPDGGAVSASVGP